MCGRFARFSSVQKFAELFGTGAGFNLNPRYNVAPTQALLLARNAVWGNRELVSLHWGLIPHWSKEPKTSYSSINARAETLRSQRSSPFRSRRCLVPASGFYEWKTETGRKQPYYLTAADDGGLAFALRRMARAGGAPPVLHHRGRPAQRARRAGSTIGWWSFSPRRLTPPGSIREPAWIPCGP
jgi:putative SOS response-associated peptidase YedK